MIEKIKLFYIFIAGIILVTSVAIASGELKLKDFKLLKSSDKYNFYEAKEDKSEKKQYFFEIKKETNIQEIVKEIEQEKNKK